MPKATTTDKTLFDPRPVKESDLKGLIEDFATLLNATGDKPRKLKFDYVMSNFFDADFLEGIVSDAVNEYLEDIVREAYEEAISELENFFE